MQTLPDDSHQADPRLVDQQLAQLEVARRYTIKLSEVIQEQARDLDSQAAALEAAASQTQMDRQMILRLQQAGGASAQDQQTQHALKEALLERDRLSDYIKAMEDSELNNAVRTEQTAAELLELTTENHSLTKALQQASNVIKRSHTDQATTKDEYMKLQSAYDEIREELGLALMQKLEMEKALQANPLCVLELQELRQRLKDSQNMLELAETQLSETNDQVTRLKQVANTMQGHNMKIMEQLNSTTTQLENLMNSKAENEACLDEEITQLQDQLTMTMDQRDSMQKLVKDNERAVEHSEHLQKQLDEQEGTHANQLQILAEEKDLAHKVVNDCLQLLSKSEKESVILRHDLSAISAQVEHGVSAENRHRHMAERSNQELEHERRERKLLERQLTEITNSVDYLRQAQSSKIHEHHKSPSSLATSDATEVKELQARVQELVIKNQQLHAHAILKSQECEILQASLRLVSESDANSQGNASTQGSLNQMQLSLQVQEGHSPPARKPASQLDFVENGTNSSFNTVPENGTKSSFNAVPKSLREEKRSLDDENDAIKIRIAQLVGRLEGQFII